MPDDPPLTDEQVYALLHAALLMFSHRTVATPAGQAVLSVAIKQMELLQQAMVIMDDEASGSSEPPSRHSG